MKKILLCLMALIGVSAFAFMPGEATSTNLNKREAQVSPGDYSLELPDGWELELIEDKLYVTDGEDNLGFDMENANNKSFSVTSSLNDDFIGIIATYRANGTEHHTFEYERDNNYGHLFEVGSFTVSLEPWNQEYYFCNIFTTGGGGDEFEYFLHEDEGVDITCEFAFIIDVPPIIEGVRDLKVEVGSVNPNYLVGVTGFDFMDGNVDVTVDSNNVNLDVLGNYQITYTAVDLSGKITTKDAIVEVVDTTAPVITFGAGLQSLPSLLSVPILPSEDLIELFGIEVTDNYYDANDIVLTVEDLNDWENHHTIPGAYYFTITAKDLSENESDSKTFSIFVIDDVPSEFTKTVDHITISKNTGFSRDYLLGLFETNEVASIIVKTNTQGYFYNKQKVGEYTETIQATDGGGNKTEHSVIINVIDNDSGLLQFDNKILQSPETNSSLDVVLAFIVQANHPNKEYILTTENYSGHEEEPGEYSITIAVDNVPYTYSVVNLTEEEATEIINVDSDVEDLSVWEQILSWLNSYWYYVVIGVLAVAIVIVVVLIIKKK